MECEQAKAKQGRGVLGELERSALGKGKMQAAAGARQHQHHQQQLLQQLQGSMSLSGELLPWASVRCKQQLCTSSSRLRLASSRPACIAVRPSSCDMLPPPLLPADIAGGAASAASDISYSEERCRRLLYRDEGLHLEVLQLVFTLICTPGAGDGAGAGSAGAGSAAAGGQLDPLYCDQYPWERKLQVSSAALQGWGVMSGVGAGSGGVLFDCQLPLPPVITCCHLAPPPASRLSLQNIPFILYHHLNHEDNRPLLPHLLPRLAGAGGASSGAPALRLLRVLCAAFFRPEWYSSRSRISSAVGAYSTVYRASLPAWAGDVGSVVLKLVDTPKHIQDRCAQVCGWLVWRVGIHASWQWQGMRMLNILVVLTNACTHVSARQRTPPLAELPAFFCTALYCLYCLYWRRLTLLGRCRSWRPWRAAPAPARCLTMESTLRQTPCSLFSRTTAALSGGVACAEFKDGALANMLAM